MKKESVIICRCEEITEDELKKAILNGAHDLDAVKRVTRAGMGLCQGRTCSKIISSYINKLTGISLAEMKQVTTRPPIRPLPIGKLKEDGPY